MDFRAKNVDFDFWPKIERTKFSNFRAIQILDFDFDAKNEKKSSFLFTISGLQKQFVQLQEKPFFSPHFLAYF